MWLKLNKNKSCLQIIIIIIIFIIICHVCLSNIISDFI